MVTTNSPFAAASNRHSPSDADPFAVIAPDSADVRFKRFLTIEPRFEQLILA